MAQPPQPQEQVLFPALLFLISRTVTKVRSAKTKAPMIIVARFSESQGNILFSPYFFFSMARGKAKKSIKIKTVSAAILPSTLPAPMKSEPN